MKQTFGKTLEHVAMHLSQWAAVQTVLGVDTEADALAKMFQWGAPSMDVAVPPRMVIRSDGLDESWKGGIFAGQLTAEILFEILIPDAVEDTDHAARTWFMLNVVDPILDDMSDNVNNPGKLIVRRRQMTVSPGEVAREDTRPSLGNKRLWIWQQQMVIAT